MRVYDRHFIIADAAFMRSNSEEVAYRTVEFDSSAVDQFSDKLCSVDHELLAPFIRSRIVQK